MNEMIKRLRANREAESQARKLILDRAEREKRGSLTDAEDREFRALTDSIAAYDDRITELLSQQERTATANLAAVRAGVFGTHGGGEYREGQPLTEGQTFRGFARAHGATEADARLNLTKILRGVTTGEWDGASAEQAAMAGETSYVRDLGVPSELRAMTGSTTTLGGFMIPTLLSSELIDLARNKAAVLQAGARIIPMANRTVDVAKWSGDPTVAWRAEGATIPASDATIGKVTLSAKSLAGLTIVSRELLEDAAEVDSQLKEAFAAQVALAIDSAALYGSGAANTPLGVKLTSGILTAAFGGANGATVANTTAWNIVADAKGTLADNNELANGVIWAPRTARQFGKLQDSTFQPLEAPEYVSDLPRFATNQIPVALTVGTSSDCSDVFVADWSQLYVGVRTGLMVSVLTERYADTGQVGIVVWTRADLVVARAKAFSVTSGLRA